MTVNDWILLIVVILLLYSALTGLIFLLRKYIFIGADEKLNRLQRELNEANREISLLRKQVNFLVEQNEEAIRKMVVVEKDNEDLKEEVSRLSTNVVVSPQKILIVVIGSDDAGMSLDLASIRAVKADTGLEILNISDVTPENLKKTLEQARRKNNHIYMHMAVKADKDGYLLGTRIVNAEWLSSILEDVIVLLVAGADSTYVGDFLGVVDYVVTMTGDVEHREAALFARRFWTGIGRGSGPTLALQRALERSPSEIRSKIIKHW